MSNGAEKPGVSPAETGASGNEEKKEDEKNQDGNPVNEKNVSRVIDKIRNL